LKLGRREAALARSDRDREAAVVHGRSAPMNLAASVRDGHSIGRAGEKSLGVISNWLTSDMGSPFPGRRS
jgi:hypothetical protein